MSRSCRLPLPGHSTLEREGDEYIPFLRGRMIGGSGERTLDWQARIDRYCVR
jgi:hypothetical protein